MANEDKIKEKIMKALKKVKDPELNKDIVSLGMIKSLDIENGVVNLKIDLTTPACPLKSVIEEDIRKNLKNIKEITDIHVEFGSQIRQSIFGGQYLPTVKNVIAVASNKGGVGKSTVAANLTVALAKFGVRVGILDADIYGPNIPTMFGVEDERPFAKNNRIIPVEADLDGVAYPIKIMSVGFLLPDRDVPVIWRAPLVNKMLQQFLSDVEWGDLDYLIVDLPPGTGDIQISLCQLIPLTGVVFVTTPQQVALEDVYKGINMFKKFEVPLLGIIENMSYFECPHCHEKTKIFDEGGAEKLANKFKTQVIGQLPLDPQIRKGGDAGKPIVSIDENHPASKIFMDAAQLLADKASVIAFIRAKQAPKKKPPTQLFLNVKK